MHFNAVLIVTSIRYRRTKIILTNRFSHHDWPNYLPKSEGKFSTDGHKPAHNNLSPLYLAKLYKFDKHSGLELRVSGRTLYINMVQTSVLLQVILKPSKYRYISICPISRREERERIIIGVLLSNNKK